MTSSNMHRHLPCVWYRVDPWAISIKSICVVGSTEKQITVRGPKWGDMKRTEDTRMAITSSFYKHFPTWQLAHEYLIDREVKNLKHHELAALEGARDLETVMAMEAPANV